MVNAMFNKEVAKVKDTVVNAFRWNLSHFCNTLVNV